MRKPLLFFTFLVCASCTVYAQINCPENLPMTLVGNTEYCVGSVGSQLSIPEVYDGYEWLPTSETSQDVTLTAGNYEAVVTHYTGCTDTIAFTVQQVPNPPQPSITANGAIEFCDGDSVILAGPDGYPYYEWSSGSVTQSVTVYQTGNYILSIRDWLGCESSSNLTTVVVNPLPNAAFSPDLEMFDIEFNNLSTNAMDYEWNFGDGITSTDFEPSHTYTTDGTLDMYLIASNNCGSDTAYFSLTSVGVEENNEQTYSLYPNPVSDILFIQPTAKTERIRQIAFIALDGRVVQSFNGNRNNVSVRQLPTGLYIVEIITEKGTSNELIRIQPH